MDVYHDTNNNSDHHMVKKPNLTIDFNEPSQRSTKFYFNQAWSNGLALDSTDVERCRLNTPEIARFLSSEAATMTPTPSLIPSSALIPTNGHSDPSQHTSSQAKVMPFDEQEAKPLIVSTDPSSTPLPDAMEVTAEQKEFALGFENALQKMRSDSVSSSSRDECIAPQSTASRPSRLQPVPTAAVLEPMNVHHVSHQAITFSTSGHSASDVISSGHHNNHHHQHQHQQHRGAQQSVNLPAVNPIDMQDQEKIKLERKRARNRLAASKCRKRKLEKIAKLEEKVRQIKGENSDLLIAIARLKDHVVKLKQDLIEHMKAGCVIEGCSF